MSIKEENVYKYEKKAQKKPIAVTISVCAIGYLLIKLIKKYIHTVKNFSDRFNMRKVL